MLRKLRVLSLAFGMSMMMKVLAVLKMVQKPISVNHPMFSSIANNRMRCACERWGPGTTKEKQANTESSKELQKRLEAMKVSREKQDTIWTTQPEVMPQVQNPQVEKPQEKK